MGNANSAEIKLSDLLTGLHFFYALGTTEHVATKAKLVTQGKPFSFDTNNGVMVICSESGAPWIALTKRLNEHDPQKLIAGQIRGWLFAGLMIRGAYVPHSNDGGRFIQRITERDQATRPS